MLCPAIVYLLLILVIYEYEVLLLKIISSGSECTRIDLRAFNFKIFPGGACPQNPPRLVGFPAVSCQPPYPKHLLTPLCEVRMMKHPVQCIPSMTASSTQKSTPKWETGYEAADSTGAGHFACTKQHNNPLVVTYLFEHTILIILWSWLHV